MLRLGGVVTGRWTSSRLPPLLRVARYGHYTKSCNVASGDRTFASKIITDREAGYDLSRIVKGAVGANNLFDICPEKNGIGAHNGSDVCGDFAPLCEPFRSGPFRKNVQSAADHPGWLQLS